jgi:hypothetical protein
LQQSAPPDYGLSRRTALAAIATLGSSAGAAVAKAGLKLE